MKKSDFVTTANLELHIEGDVIVIKNFGETTLADLQIILAAYERVHGRYGHMFALYDGRLGKGMTSEARREMLANASGSRRAADATAVFGAPFSMRILVNMLDRALIGLRKKSLGVVMFATEAEARAYLDEQRQRVLRAKTSSAAVTSAMP
ncbi:MAG TPA: hypothetical protein PKA58_24695 [Polyangium sp.]|nr:hypothetical protein [Polyangium sp.]